jgi:hypothetical protein
MADLRQAFTALDGRQENLSALESVYTILTAGKSLSEKERNEASQIMAKAKKVHASKMADRLRFEHRDAISRLQRTATLQALTSDEIESVIQDVKRTSPSRLTKAAREAIQRGRDRQASIAEDVKKQAEMEAREEREREKKQMALFEGEEAQVAVGELKVRKTFEDYYFTGNEGRFVSVWVTVANNGLESLHANPVSFTLATQDGSTVSTSSKMYRLSNPLGAVNLSQGQTTSGWLVFESTLSPEYTLTFRPMGADTVKKRLIPD